MLHIGLLFVSTEKTSSLQVVLEPSNDQDHAEGNGECRGTDASREAVGDDSTLICYMVHKRHMVYFKSQFTHRLHPRGLELSTSIMQIRQCIDCLHLHLHQAAFLKCTHSMFLSALNGLCTAVCLLPW
jgi:hypothetical protein